MKIATQVSDDVKGIWRQSFVDECIQQTFDICLNPRFEWYSNAMVLLSRSTTNFEWCIVCELIIAIYSQFDDFKATAENMQLRDWDFLMLSALPESQLIAFLEIMPDLLEKVHPGFQSRAVKIGKSILWSRRAVGKIGKEIQ